MRGINYTGFSEISVLYLQVQLIANNYPVSYLSNFYLFIIFQKKIRIFLFIYKKWIVFETNIFCYLYFTHTNKIIAEILFTHMHTIYCVVRMKNKTI